MNFAICNETFNDRSVEAGFQFPRDCGYTGIEIAPFTIAQYATEISPAKRDEVRRQAADAGLEVIGLHWLLAKTEGFYLTTSDAAVRRRTGEYLSELARLCHDLGGSLMVLGSPQQRNLLPGVPKPVAMRYAADCIQTALPVLEETEITLAVEPLGPSEGDFLLTAAEGVELCHLVGSPNCRLHLDVKAMSSESTPIPDLLRATRVPAPLSRQRSQPARARLWRSRFRSDLRGTGRDRLPRLGLGRGIRLLPRRRAIGAAKHRVHA